METLGGKGFEITLAASAEVAADLEEAARARVVLFEASDCEDPFLELAQIRRLNPDAITVAILKDEDAESWMEDLEADGVDEFLVHPVRPADAWMVLENVRVQRSLAQKLRERRSPPAPSLPVEALGSPERNRLREELAEVQDFASELESERDKLFETTRTQRQALQDKDLRIADLERSLEVLKARHAGPRSEGVDPIEVKALEAAKDALEAKLASETARVRTLERELEALSKDQSEFERGELQADLARVKEELAELKDLRRAAEIRKQEAEAELKEAQQEWKKVERNLRNRIEETLQGDNLRLESVEKELERELRLAEGLRREVQHQRREIERLKDEKLNAQGELEAAQASLQEEAKSEVDSLKSELRNLRTDLAEAQATLETEAARVAALRQELEAERERSHRAETKTAELERTGSDEAQALSIQLAQAKAEAELEKAGLKERVEEQRRELEGLKQELSRTGDEKSELAQETSELLARVEQLAELADSARVHQRESESRADALKVRVEELLASLSVREEELEALRSSEARAFEDQEARRLETARLVETLEARVKELEGEREGTRVALEKAGMDLETRQAAIERLETKLEELESELATSRAEASSYHDVSTEREGRIAELEVEATQLNEALERLERTKSVLEEDLESSRAVAQDLRLESEEMAHRLEGLIQQSEGLKNLAEDLKEARLELEEANQRTQLAERQAREDWELRQKFQGQVEELSQAIEHSQAEKRALRQELDKWMQRELAWKEDREEQLEQLRDVRHHALTALARWNESQAEVVQLSALLRKAEGELQEAQLRRNVLEAEFDELLSHQAGMAVPNQEAVQRVEHQLAVERARVQDLEAKLLTQRGLAEESLARLERVEASLLAAEAQRAEAMERARSGEFELDRQRQAIQEKDASLDELLEFQGQVFDGLAGALLMVDPQGQVTWINQSGEEIFQVSRGRAIGRSFRDVPGLKILGPEIRRSLVGKEVRPGYGTLEVAGESVPVRYRLLRVEVSGEVRTVLSLAPMEPVWK